MSISLTILLTVAAIILTGRLLKIKFNKRWWWYLEKKNYREVVRLEIAGFDSHPGIYLNVDGSEHEVTFHIAFGLSLYLTFTGLLPENWYPYYSTCRHPGGDKRYRYGERQIGLQFHNYAMWWILWMDPDCWSSTDPKWRHGSFHPFRNIKGKHSVEWVPVEEENIVLPFFEGNYNLLVTKSNRYDRWQRWFTRKSVSFNVKCGYMKDGEFVAVPVPHEGKGENSYDCGEDGTFESTFPGQPGDRKYPIRSCYGAALYFWESAMRTRQKYGSPKWMPRKFKKEIDFIRESPIS